MMMKQTPKKKHRTIIKPVCLGTILLCMYLLFVYFILLTFEEEDTPNQNDENGWPNDDETDDRADLSSQSLRHNVDTIQQSKSVIAKTNNIEEQPIHPDLINYCGDCIWKDTLYTCNERANWEVEHGKSSTLLNAQRSNLLYCTKPHEQHVSEFCGSCIWKDTDITCNDRIQWEVGNKKISILEAKKRNLDYCRKPPYILSPLCGGCSHSLSNTTSKQFRYGIPCYDLIIRRVRSSQRETAERGGELLSIVDAGRIIGNEYPECKVCHPDTCWKHYFEELSMSTDGLLLDDPDTSDQNNNNKKGYLTKYWRFDQAAPKINNPTTLVLPSIPQEFRIPPNRFDDIENYLTEKYHKFVNSTNSKQVEIFIEYNPGLAPIPNKMKEYLPYNAAYVVALRVTPANNCFKREQMKTIDQKVWDHTMMSATNLLGLALLDTSYNILEGYDIVVDLATQLGFQKDGYGTTYFGEPTFMDYRLFTLNDELYLHANADVTVVTKLDLRSKEHSREATEDEFKINVIYGSNNLEMIMLHQFNTIWSGGDRGKNFALFSIPNTTHPDEPDLTFAEIEINPIHQVQQIYLDDIQMIPRKFVKKRIRRNFSVDPIMMRRVKGGGNPPHLVNTSMVDPTHKQFVEDVTGPLIESTMDPMPSFFTVDEHFFPGSRPAFRKAGHGGACCVSLSRDEALAEGDEIQLAHESWGENDYLLVGVAHTSVIWRRWYSDTNIPDSEKAMIPHTHYVSFFYAFEPRPPFNLRAMSGYFCLGFAGEDGTEGGVYNPYSILTINRKLSQHNETFSCPQIHFVSSFIEKVDDSSSTVIGYGLNDCTPRIVEVEKKELARLLFSDPFEMKIESRNEQEMEVDSPPSWLNAWSG